MAATYIRLIAGLIYPRPVGGAGPLGPGELPDAARGGLAVRGEVHLLVSVDLSVPRRVVDLESPGRRPAVDLRKSLSKAQNSYSKKVQVDCPFLPQPI
jgi:hypothetical protein